MSQSNKRKDMKKEEDIIPKIIEKMVDSFSEDMKLAILAGCELEHEWKPALSRYYIRTKYPIAIVKQKDGKIIVYQDLGGISPEIKAFFN
jgi:hypothetical protein